MYRIFVSGIVLLWAGAAEAQPQLANPASVNCVKQGGTLSIDRRTAASSASASLRTTGNARNGHCFEGSARRTGSG